MSFLYIVMALRFILNNRDLFSYSARFIRFFFSGLWATKMVMEATIQTIPMANDWIEIKKIEGIEGTEGTKGTEGIDV